METQQSKKTERKNLIITKPKGWEVKDRQYYLHQGKQPLVFTVPAKHSMKCPMLWFDQEKGYQRELRYATNMASPFVDEQEGEAVLGHIIFRNGVLNVPARDQNLQLLLSNYHPYAENGMIVERNEEKKAENQLSWLELESEALNIARQLDVDHLEAIMRHESGSDVTRLSTYELKRDAMVFARNNPQLFLELATDESLELRNFGIKAVEAGILSISDDQRVIMWSSNKKKILTVPFDEHPYSALAAYFKTDEGMELYKNIDKRLK
jgi:hypothetical protein